MTDPSRKRTTSLRILMVLVATVLTSAMGGCVPVTDSNLPAPVANVDRMALFVPENAIGNWDGVPGPDGLIAQVMLFRDDGKGPKSVLGIGEVDVLLYEGAKPDKFLTGTKPFFSWTFTAEELAQRVVKQYTTLWGYGLQLQWTTAPRSAKVWLIARYRPPSGNAVYSSPAEQTMPVDTPANK